MAWRISWHLECDHCRKRASFAGQLSSAVEKKALRHGWVFTIDPWGLYRQLCPACWKAPDTRALYKRAKA